MKPRIIWEVTSDNETQRAKVIGGWLIRVTTDVYHPEVRGGEGGHDFDYRTALTFIPDPDHTWDLVELLTE